MTKQVNLSINEFNIILIESFRYALPRDLTAASEDCAERIIQYWEFINPAFQDQIKRDVRQYLKYPSKEGSTVELWERVMLLKNSK